MTRLLATIRCDAKIQLRNGFYYASALIVVASVILLRSLPENAVTWLLPVVIFENVVANTFYFVAGMILLEKGEGTLEAQVVTPLRTGEYLASKVLTLGALSLVESLLIVVLALGPRSGLLPLAAGIALTSVLLCLFGVAVVVRYRSINEYLMPSVLYATLLSLPLFGYFAPDARAFCDWHPLQGPFYLLGLPGEPIGTGRLVYAIVFPLLWLVPIALWSRRALLRSVLR